MARYQKAVNVWTLNPEQRKALQPGQWVYAGDKADKGIWCGQRSSGSDVVAWWRTGKRRDFRGYVSMMMEYAKG